MEKEAVLKALKELKEKAKKRNFKQSVDLIVNLKELDLKKPEHQVDFFATVRHGFGKKVKVCALVGPELKDDAKKTCDFVVTQDEFDTYSKNKAATKKLAAEYDFFIAQANIMPKVASAFGKILGSRGKMPNPKAGCIVPPSASLKPLYEKLQKTMKVSAKVTPIVQLGVGKEDSKEDELYENVSDIMSQLEAKLPQGKNNVKNAYLKLTMSAPVKIV